MKHIWQIIIIIIILIVLYLVYRSSQKGYMEYMDSMNLQNQSLISSISPINKPIISLVELSQDGQHVERLYNNLVKHNLIPNVDLFRYDKIRLCQEDLSKLKNEGVRCAIGMFSTHDLEVIRPFMNENPDFTVISTSSTGVLPGASCVIRTSSPDLDNANLIQLMYQARFGVNSAIIFYDATDEWATTMMSILSPASTRVVGYRSWWEIFRNWRDAVMGTDNLGKTIIILNKAEDTKLILQRMPAVELPIIFGDSAGFFDINEIPNSNIHLNQYYVLTCGLWNQNDYQLSKRFFGKFVNPEVINMVHASQIVSNVISRGTSEKCMTREIINLYGPHGWAVFNTDNDYDVRSRLLSVYKDDKWEPVVTGVMMGQQFIIGKSVGWYV